MLDISHKNKKEYKSQKQRIINFCKQVPLSKEKRGGNKNQKCPVWQKAGDRTQAEKEKDPEKQKIFSAGKRGLSDLNTD